MGKLLLPLIAIPLVETWLLIKMGGVIGALPTIGLVILTAVIGGGLVQRQGVATLNRAQQQMNAGQMPAAEMFAGMLIVIAGVLLITPGFFTDGLGFLCLFPPFQRWLAAQIMRSGVVKMGGGFTSGGQGSGFGNSAGPDSRQSPFGSTGAGQPGQNASGKTGRVIDAEYEVRDDE